MLPSNATVEAIRPVIYNEWQQTNNTFGDILWSDLQVCQI